MFAPDNFGTFGGTLLTTGKGGQIFSVGANGSSTLFTDIPLAGVQLTNGLRQMTFSPSGFLPGYGSLLFVSVSGSNGGGGTAGDVLTLDSGGNVVASLRQTQGLTKFDPRGLFFTSDNHLLISDAADPIQISSPSDFVMHAAAVPEPSSLAMLGLGMAGATLFARRRRI